LRGRPDECGLAQRLFARPNDGVEEQPFQAGTLLLFNGCDTLHRATRVFGQRLGLVPELCFSRSKAMINAAFVRKHRWCRRH